MSASFNSVVLSNDLVPQTLPLVQVTWSSVNLTAWRNFVQFFTEQAASQKSGVHGLRNSAGCFCGVFAYRLDMDLLIGPILDVHLFTVVDILNSPQTIRALLGAAETRAVELGCSAIRILLRPGQGALASRLRSLGLASETGQFWKMIDAAQTLTDATTSFR